jgi:hypothetical protein
VVHLLKAFSKPAPDIGVFISGEYGQSLAEELRSFVGIEVPRRREDLSPEIYQATTVFRLCGRLNEHLSGDGIDICVVYGFQQRARINRVEGVSAGTAFAGRRLGNGSSLGLCCALLASSSLPLLGSWDQGIWRRRIACALVFDGTGTHCF